MEEWVGICVFVLWGRFRLVEGLEGFVFLFWVGRVCGCVIYFVVGIYGCVLLEIVVMLGVWVMMGGWVVFFGLGFCFGFEILIVIVILILILIVWFFVCW